MSGSDSTIHSARYNDTYILHVVCIPLEKLLLIFLCAHETILFIFHASVHEKGPYINTSSM